MAFSSISIRAELAMHIAHLNQDFGESRRPAPPRVAALSRRPDLDDQEGRSDTCGAACKFFVTEVADDDRGSLRGRAPRARDLFDPRGAHRLNEDFKRRMRQFNRSWR